ncbi:LLM class flavin-dependent oxidoreductase [Actinophytocola sp.]|jgi:alkanesulfonate monooxygenase SsuD/methylene tetrahydromethanopterin reductase-like flavin-dependent oxidoreductase (luciferase family)|uniref:LLM class flavin-dependent oxidoreductase n=1 Tax=Actinophytocola sp. TaxID=1872138 RepID=UPI002EDA668B
MELPRSMEETAGLARHTDEAGYAWLGIADSPTVYQESYLHQFQALRNSTRLKVGPVVSHVVPRHPVIVANLLATLQEASDGRAVGTIATGNSAARGLGMKPATVGELREAVAAIRGYWAGTGGTFRDTRIPATGLARPAPPLVVSADGPRITALGGECGDGVLYGGTMKAEVLTRRVAAGRTRPGQEFWAGPAVSVGETVDEVLADMGPLLVAIANRAFRGDLTERGIPTELHEDVRTMWKRYDYAFHGDATRPRNMAEDIVSRPLAEYLLDNFVVWGEEDRWARTLAALADHGCDGVMLILGQRDQLAATRKITERLRALGQLPGGVT